MPTPGSALVTPAGTLDTGELYGLACSGIVAFRFKELSGQGIVCAEADCLVHYVSLMPTARPMTQADVEAFQNDREGELISCECCGAYLDTFSRKGFYGRH